MPHTPPALDADLRSSGPSTDGYYKLLTKPGIVSLLTMLTFYAKSFLDQMETVSRIERELEEGKDDRIGAAATQLRDLGQRAGAIGLTSLEEHTREIFQLWSREGRLTREVALHECQTFRRTLLRELERQLFVVIKEEDRQYYEDPLLSPDAASKFPAADEELGEAGKCLVLDRSVACVFHSMRAVEIGLKAMAKRLNVRCENEPWGAIIREIEVALSHFPAKDPQMIVYSEVATHFRFVKNAWRDHTMHARQNYSPVQARTILTHSIQIIEDLCKAGLEQL